MISKYIAFLKIGLIHPSLMILVWKLKHSKKTYLGYPQLLSLAESFMKLNKRLPHPVRVAEFGVGRGGSATVLAWLVGKHGGSLTLFDLFGRIPAPGEKDGERAKERYDVIMNRESEQYYGNISNLLDTILNELSEVCPLEKVVVVPGKYEETLPESPDQRTFDLVHIDCDWYESSKTVLCYLQTRLSPGAMVQVDDYSNWEGSQLATNEARWLLDGARTQIIGGALWIQTGQGA